MQVQSCGGGQCVGIVEEAGCFLPGTLVQSGTGAKKIEDIKVGDRVASFAGDKVTESKVSQIFKRERDHYFVLTAGDYRVKATAEHPFYIGDGKFKEVSKLKAGDRVFVLEKGRMVEKTLTSIVRVDEKTAVYNMSVDNTETFFADGFAVHNKSTCVYEMGLHNWPTIARTSETTARISVAAQTEVRPKWTGRDGMTIVLALFRGLTQNACSGIILAQMG